MKKLICTLFAVIMLSVLAIGPYSEEEKIKPDEMFGGTLKIGYVEMRLNLNIYKNPDGTLRATLDSIDQGAMGIPSSDVKIADGKYELHFSVIGGVYEGSYDEEQEKLIGEWTQSGQTFKLDMRKLEEDIKIIRPQEPKGPFPYIEEEVVYINETEGNTLAGTLTYPEGDGVFPAVILITGSGAQDRNEEIFNHKPFWVIADHLSRRGVAVLRVDDRGVGGSSDINADIATSMSFADDVLAGVEFLKEHGRIDKKKIGLIGHSEGGIIGPLAYNKNPEDIAFMVLLAGPGTPGDRIIRAQTQLLMRAMEVPEKEIKNTVKLHKRIHRVAKSKKSNEEVFKGIEKIIRRHLRKSGEKDINEKMIKANAGIYSNNWFRFFLKHDPAVILKKVKCPVLAMNGTLDLQVPWKENLEAINFALSYIGNSDFMIAKMDGLNHLFQNAETGHISEYGKIEETFCPKALNLMSDWITERFVEK